MNRWWRNELDGEANRMRRCGTRGRMSFNEERPRWVIFIGPWRELGGRTVAAGEDEWRPAGRARWRCATDLEKVS
jgi:hypothetical protein